MDNEFLQITYVFTLKKNLSINLIHNQL